MGLTRKPFALRPRRAPTSTSVSSTRPRARPMRPLPPTIRRRRWMQTPRRRRSRWRTCSSPNASTTMRPTACMSSSSEIQRSPRPSRCWATFITNGGNTPKRSMPRSDFVVHLKGKNQNYGKNGYCELVINEDIRCIRQAG